MATPIVVVPSGGIPVTEATNGFGTPVTVATNGIGTAVTVVAAGGLPVVGSGGGSPSLVQMNIAARGQMHITMNGGATAPRTRQKYRLRFWIWYASAKTYLYWGNRSMDLSVAEIGNSNSVTVVKAAVEQGAGVSPSVFPGSARNRTLTPGEFGVISMSNGAVVPGLAWVRAEVDVVAGSNTFPIGKIYRDVNNEQGGLIENCYFYDPANEIDDIDSTGALAVPTGATAGNQNPFAPVMLFGEVSPGKIALIGYGLDSIGDGDDALPSSDGSFSGGGAFVRRAAWLASVPYLSCARSAMRADVMAANSTPMCLDLMKYHSDACDNVASNDTAGLRTAAQILADRRTLWARGKANLIGRKRIHAINEIQRTDTTNKCLDYANQTPSTGHTTGGVRDQLNAALLADVGVNVDKYVDVKATVDGTADGEPNKWKPDPFTTTLAADAATNVSTASLTAMIAEPAGLGMFLILEPGTGNESTTANARVLNVSGSGPYTVSIGTNWGGSSTHLAGSTVRSSPAAGNSPGVHPEGPQNEAMAQPLAASITS